VEKVGAGIEEVQILSDWIGQGQKIRGWKMGRRVQGGWVWRVVGL
jgi:hypothetical protein